MSNSEVKFHHRVKDLTGQSFGRLTVVERVGSDKNGSSLWLCECDCGNRVTKSSKQMRNSKLPSCGCDRTLYARSGKVKHGMHGTRTYIVWQAMKARVKALSKSRGCRTCDVLCESWKSFEGFHQDMGNAPDGGHLALIERSGRYEPGNAHWVTKKFIANNRRSNRIIEVEGQKMTISQAAEMFGINYPTLVVRINRLRMSPSEAVSKPVRKFTRREAQQ